MTKKPEQDISIEERYKFIDFLLLFKGKLSRSELVKRFNIGEATASRTIASFLDKFPEGVEYLGPRNGYKALHSYEPKFLHNPIYGLEYVAYGQLTQVLGIHSFGTPEYNLVSELDFTVTSTICRGVVNGTDISIEYTSNSSGNKIRQFLAHAIFEAGGFWYFRGFDYLTNEYRTFKFSRVKSAKLLSANKKYSRERDDEWNRKRAVELIPHPKNPLPDAQLADLGIKDREIRTLTISEAMLGFVLTNLRVDCSKGHKLDYKAYPLALKNYSELTTVSSMVIAPGFNP